MKNVSQCNVALVFLKRLLYYIKYELQDIKKGEMNMENTMGRNKDIFIRPATLEDAQKLLDIYGYYVENTAITYEYDVPALEEFQNRMQHIMNTYPYLVALVEDQIVGYAYASQFHPRAAYGWNAEMTIYLDHDQCGNGVGRKLYTLLEQILKEQGIVKAVALITPPGKNAEESVYPSMHFHEKMGYQLAGCMRNSGYKFDKWFDTITMDKQIGIASSPMTVIKPFESVRKKFFEET